MQSFLLACVSGSSAVQGMGLLVGAERGPRSAQLSSAQLFLPSLVPTHDQRFSSFLFRPNQAELNLLSHHAC
jgi:hypothetical protein